MCKRHRGVFCCLYEGGTFPALDAEDGLVAIQPQARDTNASRDEASGVGPKIKDVLANTFCLFYMNELNK